MKNKVLTLGLAGLMSLGAAEAVQAQTKLDMATPWGGGVMLEYAARGSAKNMEMTTNNSIKVEVYPAGTLGKALKVTDTVRKGVAQTSHNWPGYD